MPGADRFRSRLAAVGRTGAGTPDGAAYSSHTGVSVFLTADIIPTSSSSVKADFSY